MLLRRERKQPVVQPNRQRWELLFHYFGSMRGEGWCRELKTNLAQFTCSECPWLRQAICAQQHTGWGTVSHTLPLEHRQKLRGRAAKNRREEKNVSQTSSAGKTVSPTWLQWQGGIRAVGKGKEDMQMGEDATFIHKHARTQSTHTSGKHFWNTQGKIHSHNPLHHFLSQPAHQSLP